MAQETDQTDGKNPSAQSPLLVVGWDGAPYSIVRELVDEGSLPTLAGIAEDGYFGSLETVPYVMSSCAWSTILTGKNAGKHGIFDFYSNDFKEGSYFREPIDSTKRTEAEIGDMLNIQGQSIGQINIPMTYPARDYDEFAISGMISPNPYDEQFVSPQGFLDDYDGLDEYKIDLDEDKDAERDVFINDIKQMIDTRMDLTCYALDRSDQPDVFFVVFTAPDRFSHFLWHFYAEDHPYQKNESQADLEKYSEVLIDLFQNLDDKLADLIDQVEEKYATEPTVAVMSDHGMKSLERIFHVNKWLSDNGYLTFKDGQRDDSLDNNAEELLNEEVEYIFGKVDWENTKAYSLGKRGAIYINLEGREPEGTVPPEERANVIEQLRDDISTVADPDTGEKIINEIKTREELFHGDNISRAPDLLVDLTDGYYPFGYAFELERDNLISVNDRPELPFVTGIEDGDGIFAVSGPAITPDADSVNLSLEDIAPLVLYQQNVAVPNDLDGTIPRELFTETYREEVSVTERPPITDLHKQEAGTDDTSAVEERLEDLGYL